MTAKVQKLISTAVLSLALLSHSLPAWAGLAVRKEVSISPSGVVIQGSLTGARYSMDTQQYLGCDQYRHSYFNNAFVSCTARDRNGRYAYCISTDPRIMDAVKGMSDSSDLNITIGLDGGRYVCTDLTISNESIHLP